ncbi:MAG: hypothetical protein HXY34_03110 [Candidatus Thorarchaeota archaeon]|nr:hypothetical protein [Candidatus Thorarchaeota archaeon]
MKKVLVLLQPEDVGMSAKDFLSQYGSYLTDVGMVAKRTSGQTVYQSKTAPVDPKHTQFFEDWVKLANALSINSVAGMDFYTDGWFARDPKYQTMTSKGKAMTHQICPNREEFWQYGAEIVRELGCYPINEIFLFGIGFIGDHFCFCERCKKEFAPKVNQEPKRLTYEYVSENPEYHTMWHRWRAEKVAQGLAYLRDAARDADAKVGRADPLRLSVEVLIDPITGLSEGAKDQYGYDYTKFGEVTGNILINLFPWSPLLPRKGSKEYNDLVESLYFTGEFKRRGGRVSLFRWGVTSTEQIDELRALAKDCNIDRIVTTLQYPGDYSTRRESAIGSY